MLETYVLKIVWFPMKERINFHLLKLVFKALYSDAWPSYLKINEVAHTGLAHKCRKKIHTVAVLQDEQMLTVAF